MNAPSMPIRVLMLAENPYMGGITSHILTALHAFKDDPGIRLIPATLPGLRPDNTLVDAAASAGFHVQTFRMTHRFDPRVLGRLRRFVRDEHIDLVHVHGYRGAVVAELARLPVPVVSTCHGELVAPALRSRLWERLSLWAMRRHVRVIACAGFVREWLLQEGLSAERVTVIPNATLPPSVPREEDVRQHMQLAPDQLLVVFAGRLVEGKGLSVLLDALNDLPDIAAAIVGEGELAPALRQQAAPMGDRIWLAGRRNHVGDFFEAADVVVLPSQQEALPMTLIEAASWGKPVVATRVGGIPEIVVHDETGLLVPYGDVAALKTVLARLKDAALRKRFGENARKRWEQHFSPATLAAALREVYRQAVS
jgi:glycosyltransferase involved in cell wall biosynthesis